MLKGTYFPRHADNRLSHEGDVGFAREHFIKNKANNLKFLLARRYAWMNDYIRDLDSVIELGCGAGLSKFFLDCPGLILTDVHDAPWVDQRIDALNIPFDDDSIDAFICSHMIHHLANPHRFFSSLHDALKPGGLVIIQDIYTSLLMRILLRVMRHEGWSYDVDVFDPSTIANNPDDPWSANCAIPELLFHGTRPFEEEFPGFSVIKNERNECLVFPLSGGVTAKTRTIPLPLRALKLVDAVDKLLVALSPGVFAFGCSIVLRKNAG